jgi:hypothetical protein
MGFHGLVPGKKRFWPYVSDGTILNVSVKANLRDKGASGNMASPVHADAVPGTMLVLLTA